MCALCTTLHVVWAGNTAHEDVLSTLWHGWQNPDSTYVIKHEPEFCVELVEVSSQRWKCMTLISKPERNYTVQRAICYSIYLFQRVILMHRNPRINNDHSLQVWLSLLILMRPDFGDSIQSHLWPYSVLPMQITKSDTRLEIKLVVILMIADGHFNLLCGFVRVCISLHAHFIAHKGFLLCKFVNTSTRYCGNIYFFEIRLFVIWAKGPNSWTLGSLTRVAFVISHSTKKPVTTMLTYPWKCTVLHCNHLENTWKPLVLMT